MAAPAVLVAERKCFKPKNDLPKLADYSTDPGQGFWQLFPENQQKLGVALIDHRKLRGLAMRGPPAAGVGV
jgi:hypothetical protein